LPAGPTDLGFASWEVAEREERMTGAWRYPLVATTIALSPINASHAVELDPAALVYKLPDQLKMA
jgi:hypothetical protein